MKQIDRLPLSPSAVAFLEERTRLVIQAKDPQAEAARLWKLQGTEFSEIRGVLERMASGIQRCMYCEDSAGTAIDHFWPKARYPKRAFDWINYLLACSRCNGKKSQQFPLDARGEPLLFDPTQEDPLKHLAFSPSTGQLTARSPKGAPSIRVYGLDRKELEEGRRIAWNALETQIIGYARDLQEGDTKHAARIEEVVRKHPFAGVLAALVRFATGPDAALLVEPRCLTAIQQHPEILSWA
jgi:uncharacterized protein (TIGR02646 family)